MLLAQLKEFQAIATKVTVSPAAPEKGLSTRERESLLKLIIGMAMAGYRYDPKVARSDKIGEIANDLVSTGVSLDVDTVRKWLKEAGQLLPRESCG
jgi:hypothetical protein